MELTGGLRGGRRDLQSESDSIASMVSNIVETPTMWIIIVSAIGLLAIGAMCFYYRNCFQDCCSYFRHNKDNAVRQKRLEAAIDQLHRSRQFDSTGKHIETAERAARVADRKMIPINEDPDWSRRDINGRAMGRGEYEEGFEEVDDDIDDVLLAYSSPHSHAHENHHRVHIGASGYSHDIRGRSPGKHFHHHTKYNFEGNPAEAAVQSVKHASNSAKRTATGEVPLAVAEAEESDIDSDIEGKLNARHAVVDERLRQEQQQAEEKRQEEIAVAAVAAAAEEARQAREQLALSQVVMHATDDHVVHEGGSGPEPALNTHSPSTKKKRRNAWAG